MNEDCSMFLWGGIALGLIASLLVTAFVCWLWRRGVRPFDGVRGFLRRPWCEVLIVLVCVGGLVQYGASKGSFGGFLGMLPPSEQMNLATALVAYEDVDGMFPAYTNVVTNVCATGIKPADASVFVRVHWPTTLSPVPTGVEVYAAPVLAKMGWTAVGTAPVSGSGNSQIIELPHSILPEGWEHAMFFTLGLPFDADGDSLTDQFERVVLSTDPDNPDSDEDGLDDGWEYEHGLNPTSEDTDGDGLSDASETARFEDGVVDIPWFTVQPLVTYSPATDTDRALVSCEMPFAGSLAGCPVSVALADVNGVVYFGCPSTTNGLSSSNIPLDLSVAGNGLNAIVAGYWTDLYMRSSLGSSIVIGTATNGDERYFVVQYGNVGLYSGSANHVSFQVSVPESRPDVVYVRYGEIVDARTVGRVTIGMQGTKVGRFENCPALNYYYQASPPAMTSGQTIAFRFGTGGDPQKIDTDEDGLDDRVEATIGTNLRNADSDGDGFGDAEEIAYGMDPLSSVGRDGLDGDADGDGLSNGCELKTGTSPGIADCDGDGILDGDETGTISVATDGGVPWLAFDAFEDCTAQLVPAVSGRYHVNRPLPCPISVQDVTVTNITFTSLGWIYLNRAGTQERERYDGTSDFGRTIDEDVLALAPYGNGWLFVQTDAGERSTSVRYGTATYEGEGYVVLEYDNLYRELSASRTNAISFQVAIPTNRANCAYVRYRDLTGERMDGRDCGIGMQTFDGKWLHAYCHNDSGLVYEGLSLRFAFGRNTNPLDEDADDDGIPDGEEVALGTSPCRPDTDGDGLDDGYEYETGLLDPLCADTDRDGLPDGWEVENGLLPTSEEGGDGAAGDPDQDGLSNLDEYGNNSDPHERDSDGDGVDDRTEVDNGSDPSNPADGGAVPAADRIREVAFNVGGDWAAWELTIEGMGPDDWRVMHVTMVEPGNETNAVERLHKDNSYRLTMKWLNCDGYDDRSDSPWYCWQLLVDGKPDVATFAGYDNERREGVADVVVGNGWIAENADGLLTQHVCENNDDSGNVAEGREAILHVFDIEHDLLWETGNKANQIFNPTPKDDASGEVNDAEVERDETGNVKFRYAAPRNNLYVVSDSASRTFNVTEKIRPPHIPVKFIDRIMCAAFVGEEMVEGSATRFSGAYEAAMQIPAPGGAVKMDYALRVGIDVNDDGALSFDESIPIEVYKYKTDDGIEPRYANIRGSTNERCVECDTFIGGKINGVFGALTGIGVPIGKVLLSIFYYGNTNHLNGSLAFLPSKINTVTINAFAERSGFSEWLTHNSGAQFNDEGGTEIKEYVWHAQTQVSQLFANCSPLVPWVHYSLPGRNNFDYQSSIYGPGIPNFSWLKDEFDLETGTGRKLEEHFKRSVIPLARIEMQELSDGAVRTFPLDGGWYGVELFTNVVESMSHPCIEGTTVVFGDKGQHYKGAIGMGMEAGLKELVASGGQLGNLDAFIAVGRGRVVEPGYQFTVRKSVNFFGRITYELVSIAFKCKIQDLYDFNFEDGDLSQNAATMQIGFGKGDYGRNHGKIFRHEIQINTVYQNPFVR